MDAEVAFLMSNHALVSADMCPRFFLWVVWI